MDIVKTYLYGNLNTTIYIRAPPKLIERQKHHIKEEHYHGETIHKASHNTTSKIQGEIQI